MAIRAWGRSAGEGHLLDSARLAAPAQRFSPEDRAIDLNAALAPYTGAAIVGLGLAVLLLLVLVAVQTRRLGGLSRRLDRLTRGSDGSALDAVLDAHVDKIYAVAGELDDLSARSAVLEANGRRAIQRVGVVRFNPFEDTGGNQSFAVALTDAAGSGIIVSSLHSRTGTRVYAKSVVEGRPDGALSEEESEALRIALGGRGGAAPAAGRTGERVARPA